MEVVRFVFIRKLDEDAEQPFKAHVQDKNTRGNSAAITGFTTAEGDFHSLVPHQEYPWFKLDIREGMGPCEFRGRVMFRGQEASFPLSLTAAICEFEDGDVVAVRSLVTATHGAARLATAAREPLHLNPRPTHPRAGFKHFRARLIH